MLAARNCSFRFAAGRLGLAILRTHLEIRLFDLPLRGGTVALLGLAAMCEPSRPA